MDVSLARRHRSFMFSLTSGEWIWAYGVRFQAGARIGCRVLRHSWLASHQTVCFLCLSQLATCVIIQATYIIPLRSNVDGDPQVLLEILRWKASSQKPKDNSQNPVPYLLVYVHDGFTPSSSRLQTLSIHVYCKSAFLPVNCKKSSLKFAGSDLFIILRISSRCLPKQSHV